MLHVLSFTISILRFLGTVNQKLRDSPEHTDEEKVPDAVTSSSGATEKPVSHELESLPPGENVKEEAATQMETVPNPACM